MPDEGASLGPDCLFDMTAADLGIPDDPKLTVYSQELNVPVVAGQPYAFSFQYRGGAYTHELWGTNEHCGLAMELLASWEIPGDGSYCIGFVAMQDHTHWFEVARGGPGGGVRSEINRCPMSTCP